MIRVLEFLLGVEPAVDADVAGWTVPGDRDRLRDADPGRGREQSRDPVARPERPQGDHAGGEGNKARGDEDEGGHRGMIAADRPSACEHPP
jgi:hypothetical protein